MSNIMRKERVCMKKLKIGLCVLLSLTLLAVSGCGTSPDGGEGNITTTTTTESTTTTTSAESDESTTTSATTTESGDTTTTTAAPMESGGGSATTTTSAPPVVGDEIAFTVNDHVRVHLDDSQLAFPNYFAGHILRDADAFAAMKIGEIPLYSPHADSPNYREFDLTPYTEAYFADKAVVVLYMSAGIGNVRITIDRLTVEGDTLTVEYTKEYPYKVTDEGSEWCLLLEVDAAAVKNVTKVEGVSKTVYLPPSSGFGN